MFTTAVVILVIVVAALLIAAAMRPDTFRVERRASIAAPPEKIFALVNDYRQWPAWSPYEKMDPAMKKSFSGPASGKGAVYEWEGNAKAGKGRIEIVDAAPPNKISMKLDMLKPMEGHNSVDFVFTPKGGATDVSWTMQGKSPFIGKLFGLVFNMDKMVGGQFDEGLAKLKALSEAQSA